jgi:hypothetical protein
MSNAIAFNTRRGYTDKGQRIAAKRIGDRVIFVDIDRGLDYVTSGPCELSQRAIMRAYDYNETESVYAVIPDYSLRQSVIDELETMAREAV